MPACSDCRACSDCQACPIPFDPYPSSPRHPGSTVALKHPGTSGTLALQAPQAVIKLLAIDVDGTLLDSRGKLPPDNLEALTRRPRRRDPARDRDRAELFVRAAGGGAAARAAAAHRPQRRDRARARRRDAWLRRLLPRDSARAVLAGDARLARASTLLYFDRPRERQIVTDRLDWTHPNRARFHERNRDIIEEVAALEGALDRGSDSAGVQRRAAADARRRRRR